MKLKAIVFGIFLALSASVSAQVTISTPYVSASTSTTVTVVWTTNVPANSSVKYGINNLQYQTVTDPTLVTSHSVTIQLLMAGPIYSVAAVSIDASGNTAQSATMLTALCGDALEPVAGTVNPFYEGGPYQITWNPPPGTTLIPPTVCGTPLNQTVSGILNDFGSFSNYVGDSFKIRPGPGNWTVHITDKGNLSPISATVPLSQVTQDVSDVMKAQAALAGLTGCIANVLTGLSWPPTCAGSGGGSGPLLQTNGVSNFLQSILDLDNGNNLVVTNTSGGHVRFDVTGIPPAVTFQTNTVNNLSQVLLDLDQGTGITITNTSGGHVRFDVTAPPPALTVQTNAVNNLSQTLLNFTNTATITFLNSSGGVETAVCSTATNSTIGCLRPDGTTCTVSAGVLTCPGSGGTPVHFELNDVLLGGQFAATPQIFDLNSAFPAAPTGSVNCTWQTDTSTGRVSCFVPVNTVNLQMQPVAPTTGNFVVLYPQTRSGVSGTSGFCPDQGNWNMILNGASGLIVGATCAQTMSGPWVTSTGQTLASLGISTSSVTSVYTFAYTSLFPGYFDDGSGIVVSSVSLSCGGFSILPGLSDYSIQQVTALTGITGAGIAGTTCSEGMSRNSSIGNTASTAALTVPSMGLIVFYSGPPATLGTLINVAPPLTFDLLTQTIGLSKNFPQIVYPDTVGALPPALANVGAEANVTDSASPFTCTTGGGINYVTCVATPTGWFAKQSLVASLESVNLQGGTLGSIPYQTAPNVTAFVASPTTLGHTYAMGWVPSPQPQVVQARNCLRSCAFSSPVASGDLIVAVTIDGAASPSGCTVVDTFSTTFTNQQSGAFANSYTGFLTSSGTDTVTASAAACNLLIVEVSGANVSTPVDVAGAVSATTSSPITPAVTTVTANDTIIMWQGYEQGTLPITLTLTPAATLRAGTGLGPVGNPYNVWSLPAPTASAYSATITASPTGHIFVGAMLALKAGPGGEIAPQAIDLTSTVAGVASLNSLTGALSLISSNSTVSITPSGSTIDLKVVGGGSSSTVASAEVVSFSATPTFSTVFNVSRIVLAGNITTFTIGAGLDGQSKTLCFKQGSGPFTVTPPVNVHGFFTVGTINADWNCQPFVYDLTDSIWQAVAVGVINE